jgi:hypothetical protein
MKDYATDCAVACTHDTDCAADRTCEFLDGDHDGLCASRTCTSSDDCDRGAECVPFEAGVDNEGICVPTCSGDTDCAPGLSCIRRSFALITGYSDVELGGETDEFPDLGTVTRTLCLPAGGPARDGIVSCRANSDCDDSQLCQFPDPSASRGVCTTTCADDEQCGAFAVCTSYYVGDSAEATTSSCQQSGENDGDCARGFTCGSLDYGEGQICMPPAAARQDGGSPPAPPHPVG